MQVLNCIFAYNIYKRIYKIFVQLHGYFFNLKLYVKLLAAFDGFRPFQEFGALFILVECHEISFERLYFNSVLCYIEAIFCF